MTEYSGKTVCGGIAIGKLHIIAKTAPSIEKYEVADSSREIQRLEAAKEEAKAQLANLYEKAAAEVGEAKAAIFEVHQMLIDDSRYLEFIQNIITEQQVNAEYAVSVTADQLGERFTKTGDAYMIERAADVKDISDRIIRNLVREDGKELSDKNSEKPVCFDNRNYEHADSGSIITDAPVIILADDLSPSETVQLDKNLVLSFVMVHGSVNSHAAILARTMNKPALIGVGIEITPELEGKTAIVDAITGKLYIEPDGELLNKMQKCREEDLEKQKRIRVLKGKESVTLDGQAVSLCANIGSVSDLEQVIQNDAEGIGLFRSEFIYLERNTFPTEEEQFRIYRQVAETLAGKRVIIRTLDIGADKQADYFELGKEENPALGLRAIRVCLTRPEIFKVQLRAIYRASKYGNLAIMYPMIASLEEVKKIKEISAQVKSELDQEGTPYNDIEEGIMIETPAAVMISDILVREVDFFSIGTNDLSQYTMAIDRQNPILDQFFDPHHEAVLRMIEMVCKNAHAENIWVGICGELGADLELTERFLKMGVDELSVSPSYVLPLRDRVRNLDLSR